MSVATNIQRVMQARDQIRDHLVGLGVASGNETIDELAVIVEGLDIGYANNNLQLNSIVLTPPNKTIYEVGQQLDLDGCIVTANYNGDVTKDSSFSPLDGSVFNETGNIVLTASYAYNGVIKQDSVSIEVTRQTPYIVLRDGDNDDNSTVVIDDIANLCGNTSSTSTVTVSGRTIPKRMIRQVHLNNEFTDIPNYFCNSCINLEVVDGLEEVETIGDDFLAMQTGVNGKQYNSPIVFGNKLKSIGLNFMNNAKVFNQPVILCEGIESISHGFLNGCLSFNQPLYFPSTLTSVGVSVLGRCRDMTDTLTINCPATVFAMSDSTCKAYDNSCRSYTIGITIDGPYANEFKERFPNHATRNLI